MILDHPFQFYIYDKEQGLMLFEGRLGSPEVPDAKPTSPLLDAKQMDADFWANLFGINPIDPTGHTNGAHYIMPTFLTSFVIAYQLNT
jgi:hypothetical protein